MSRIATGKSEANRFPAQSMQFMTFYLRIRWPWEENHPAVFSSVKLFRFIYFFGINYPPNKAQTENHNHIRGVFLFFEKRNKANPPEYRTKTKYVFNFISVADGRPLFKAAGHGRLPVFRSHCMKPEKDFSFLSGFRKFIYFSALCQSQVINLIKKTYHCHLFLQVHWLFLFFFHKNGKIHIYLFISLSLYLHIYMYIYVGMHIYIITELPMCLYENIT